MILKIILSNGTVMHGPASAALKWLEQQCGYRPQEILPATIALSPFISSAQANEAHEQWVENLEF